MKNTICLLILFIGFSTQAQKKGAKSSKTTSSAIAKVDNLIAEVKNGNFQVSITDKGKTVDAITVKPITSDFKPTNCKISSFTANGSKLYVLSWDENSKTNSPRKSEDIITSYAKIYEISTKKEVFYNTKLVNNITEQVYLDKNKSASETQNKIRREGFELFINPDGSITQKGKNQENKWVYDASKMEFIDAKKKK